MIETAHYLLGLLALGADNHTVGRHEVFDGGSLLEELRVGGDIEGDIHPTAVKLLKDGLLDFAGGADRDGGFGDKYGVFLDVAAKFAGHLQHIFEVGRAILVRRSAYC